MGRGGARGGQSRLLMALTFWRALVLWVEVDGLILEPR